MLPGLLALRISLIPGGRPAGTVYKDASTQTKKSAIFRKDGRAYVPTLAIELQESYQ